jgi:hypothetical protein
LSHKIPGKLSESGRWRSGATLPCLLSPCIPLPGTDAEEQLKSFVGMCVAGEELGNDAVLTFVDAMMAQGSLHCLVTHVNCPAGPAIEQTTG